MIEENYIDRYMRVCATVDLDAIRSNFKQIRQSLPEHVKVMAVIKADGYGHGAVPVARALSGMADMFGVAIIEEALDLRAAGIKEDILLLGYISPEYVPDAVAHDITLTVYSYDMADDISAAALRLDVTAKLHIKVDTGMGRIGFLDGEPQMDEIARICSLPGVNAEGIYTHLASADETDKSSALAQLELFRGITDRLEHRGLTFDIKHAANSAAVLDMPEACFDMVRAGIVLYGMYPSEETDHSAMQLKPAMSLRTHISHIKTVPAGTRISYGGTFTAQRETVVATVPVGYADGFPRVLSNRGRILVRGAFAPIIGRICMDQFMIDVTDIPKVSMRDTVTLVGTDRAESISTEEVAAVAGSFNYEFVCNVSKRVPRLYVIDGIKSFVRRDGEIM
jgi:alanine racemase